jgi:glyoxylase-like metal-dependent hydrolase (beta-lactamase superfamily II)
MTNATPMPGLNRRQLVTGALAFAAHGLSYAHAAAPLAGTQAPAYYRARIGSFEVTAVHDGAWLRAIDEKFVRNTPYADVQAALAESFQAPGVLTIPFTPLVVNTGRNLVLIDTGTGGQFVSFAPQSGTWQGNLAAAGIRPTDVDAILISHCHPDHINGIKTKDNALTFPNAEIFVSLQDWNYWLDEANPTTASDAARPQFLNARRIFRDIASKVTRFEPGRELVPGITALAAFGHTPGHVAFAVASGDRSLLVLSDTTNNPYLFARHPEWQPTIDVDGPRAVETRKRLLDRATADRMLVHGYHFPFPALGHIARRGGGYEFVPSMWQARL